MKLLTILSLVFSFSALAKHERLIDECRDAGTRAVVQRAQEMNVSIDQERIYECGVDARILNPFKYVWFCADALEGDEVVSVLTVKIPRNVCVKYQ